jgi:hypothetical protein
MAIAVLITTDSSRRGVFAGFTNQDPATIISTGTVALSEARNCIYWSSSVGGVFGLAKTGPDSECRIGEQVAELHLNGVTSVTVLSPKAATAWAEAKTYGK